MQSVFPLRSGIREVLFQTRASIPLKSQHSLERFNRRRISWRKDLSFPVSIDRRLEAEFVKCSSTPQTGIFPSGKKQPQLEIPALVLSVGAQEVLDDPEVLKDISNGVAGGVTAILLREENVNSAELYEAALQLQSKLRERASLFIMGRSDIAEAVEATGVLLTNEGVPLAVARRTLGQGAFLLGRIVDSVEEAGRTAAEGASFVCFHREDEVISQTELTKAKRIQRGGTIPVLPVLDTSKLNEVKLTQYLTSELDGVVLKQSDLRRLNDISGTTEEITTRIKSLLQSSKEDLPTPIQDTSVEVCVFCFLSLYY